MCPLINLIQSLFPCDKGYPFEFGHARETLREQSFVFVFFFCYPMLISPSDRLLNPLLLVTTLIGPVVVGSSVTTVGGRR
jgi:hypothetical protein